MSDRVDSIRAKVFRDETATVWAIFDGASVPDLRQQLSDHEPEHACLFRGDLEPDMQEVAPYLVKLDPNGPITEWVLEKGWGQHWCIFSEGPDDFIKLRSHFRSFIEVHDPAGKPMYFRYYDPRVMRVYLPTCNSEELQTIFGPMQSYMMEDENPAVMLRFRLKEGSLAKQTETIA